jgi:hypothetical protein
MLKELAQYLVSLGEAKLSIVVPGNIENTFSDKPLFRPDPPRPVPQATARQVATLRSLVDYLEYNVDGLALGEHLIHVVSPTKVELVSRLEDVHRRRETVLVAAYDSGVDAYLDKWVELEQMVIGLMSLFTEEGDRSKVLDLLKSIGRDNAEIREDDGLSQRVTVKVGVATKAAVSTVNPVTLYPFSTFPEASQVPRLFVLRLADDNGVKVLLKPADGNAWKVAAVSNVARALKEMRVDMEAVPQIIF